MISPAGQTEAVDGDARNGVVLHLEADAGVDGTGLIFGDGEDSAADERFQGVLGDADARPSPTSGSSG